jgi:hypothetical protein
MERRETSDGQGGRTAFIIRGERQSLGVDSNETQKFRNRASQTPQGISDSAVADTTQDSMNNHVYSAQLFSMNSEDSP